MAASVIVDSGFLIALLSARDTHHAWAAATAARHARPWLTCESALSETHHFLTRRGRAALLGYLSHGTVDAPLNFRSEQRQVLALMKKYADVPMSVADGCLVRMTEILPDSLLLTTDSDFRVYRRNGRQVIPCVLPA